ncbi:TAF5-like RNA polymerase II p300/CBP-associated factor-associated factor 65 kDa subunit 5L [Clavelina lepadiformis]|uniref:TAF5-like RNA polymerase II p300/CBP-associated factor-associated factor 65 kDa subunit 5L n=1 Tax=Clavelina lepadiformis TaxID=159417 RepID=UPI0040411920
MKRARTEQLQATLLSYLKKRNFTDSEAGFRNNVKFEETLVDVASRTLLENKISLLDSVAMSTHDLKDYFLAFKGLQEFVCKAIADDKYHGFKNLLFPVFVHCYLDLIMAGRLKEAEEFYVCFSDSKHFKVYNEVLTKLYDIRESNDLQKYFLMPQIRNQFCEMSLSQAEKQLLMRFLQGQPYLLLLKLMNERIRISSCSHKARDIGVSTQPHDASPDNVSFACNSNPDSKLQEHDSKANVPDEPLVSPMIISPPSLVPVGTSSTTQGQAVDAAGISLDLATLRRRVQEVRDSAPRLDNFCLYRLKENNNAIIHATSSNNRTLLCTGHEESTVNLWNICNQNFSKSLKYSQDFQRCSESSEIFDTEPSSSNVDISSVSFGCEFLNDVLLKNEMRSVNRKKQLFDKPGVTTLYGHSGPVYDSCFTHDDKFLLTCSEDTTVRLWDMTTLANRVIYQGHTFPIWCIDISAMSMYFATGSYDKTAKLWSVDRTYPLRMYAGHQHSVESVCFHGNASYLATADHTVRLWDINSGKTVRLLMGHWAPVTCLAFSPDGKSLVSSGEDCRIRVWDISSGMLVKEIRAHTDTVRSLHFSLDGSLLTSCGADGSVFVWDVNCRASVNAAEASAKSSSNPNIVAHIKLNKKAKRLLSSSFFKDFLNVFSVH